MIHINLAMCFVILLLIIFIGVLTTVKFHFKFRYENQYKKEAIIGCYFDDRIRYVFVPF